MGPLQRLQIHRLAVHHQLPSLGTVAHKQLVHDEMRLFGGEQMIAVPPSLEFQVAVRFRVHVGPQVIMFVPQGVGRVEVLETGHQMGPVEHPVAQISP
jgi:hypothetical protein